MLPLIATRRQKRVDTDNEDKDQTLLILIGMTNLITSISQTDLRICTENLRSEKQVGERSMIPCISPKEMIANVQIDYGGAVQSWWTPLKSSPVELTEPPAKSNHSLDVHISKHICHRLRDISVCPPRSRIQSSGTVSVQLTPLSSPVSRSLSLTGRYGGSSSASLPSKS